MAWLSKTVEALIRGGRSKDFVKSWKAGTFVTAPVVGFVATPCLGSFSGESNNLDSDVRLVVDDVLVDFGGAVT